MAKACPDAVMDLILTNIATCTRMVACSGQPANFAGIAAVALADIALTAGDGNGDYVIADDGGAGGGRKLTIAAQNAVDIDVSNTATHVSLDDGSVLRYVTTCTSQALVDTGTVNFPAWKIQIQDPDMIDPEDEEQTEPVTLQIDDGTIGAASEVQEPEE